MSYSEARSEAEAVLTKLAARQSFRKLSIVDEAAVETDLAFTFLETPYAFTRDGDVSAALAANLPIKVPRGGTGITYEMTPTDPEGEESGK